MIISEETIPTQLKMIYRERRLQEHGVELLWVKLQDLLVTTADEPRREALTFFEAVIRGQYLQLVILFFKITVNFKGTVFSLKTAFRYYFLFHIRYK